jgi:hypothetical protein
MLIPKIEKQTQKSKEKQGFNIEQHSIEGGCRLVAPPWGTGGG